MTDTHNKGKKIAVIGGGAAGMMAAIYAADVASESGEKADVTVFERNKKTGAKLRITGKGRCNVTNNSDVREFMNSIVNNPKFLYSALNFLTPAATIALFEENMRVPLKTERGMRVFPASDNAHDIANALERYALSKKVKISCSRVKAICINDSKISGLVTENGVGEIPFDSVIIATGGLSYPKTGSDGDGYKLAKSAGHTVTECRPSLVPIETARDVSALAGLSLKNVTLKITETNDGKEKIVFSELGECLFTHFGLSGPLILSASAHIQNLGEKIYTAFIDLKPALDEAALDRRLLSDFQKYNNRDFINSLSDLLPNLLIPYITAESEIPERIKVNSILKEQRKVLLTLMKSLPFELSRFRPIDEAVVTAGGISVKEINPKTMESKIAAGLYFAGEVIDVDAYTGGYNLQIAFSTGALAGKSAASTEQ